ncbi:MAG: 16S rRNA (uracil(1498)-N(3))-methyltransferase [Chloroflexota bacterium]|nr:16S rRNA (uracil(1498)-N(3))-methyltransferase [Chloroflexota bacterium]
MNAAHRFFVDPTALSGDRAALAGDQAKQIASVLRLGAGDEIVLVTGGEEIVVRLDAVARGRVEGIVIDRRAAAAEPALRLTLALPLLRGDRGEEVVEAVTQLGVSRIVPLVSERSVVRELSRAKRERWERIARESAETARRGRVPRIDDVVAWPRLFDALEPPVVVAWEGERDRVLAAAVGPSLRSLSLVIGPEGGLSEEEVALARERGASVVTLGRRNLRSETAAIAAVAQAFLLAEAMRT